MIYSVTVKRMQVWNWRVDANSPEHAKELADEMSNTSPANDDYGYDTTAKPSKDQNSKPDNAP